MSSGRSRSAGPSHRNTAASESRIDHKTSIIGISIEQLGISSSLRSVITALFGLFISYTWLKFGIESSQTLQSKGFLAIQPTLVIYVYSNSDPEYLKNLEFFMREAIKPNDGCDYVIVLQQNAPEDLPWPSNSLLNTTTTASENFPLLPPNARFLLHPNECYDLGTVGWVLQTQINNINKYKYFIWLNSSVRGPFLPPFLRNSFHWTRPFTSKLSSSLSKKAGQVKLVGSTINCGGAHGLPPQPHVQSYVSATDAIGLQILQAAPGVFSCWEKMADVVVHSEIGASKAIFDAGYSIDCLMSRYQGFNWLEYYQVGSENNKNNNNSSGLEVENSPVLPCNEGLNPLQPDFNDGIDVNIYEVLFIKVKESFLKSDGWRSAVAAATTARWIEETDTGGAVLVDSVQRNTWLEQGVAEKVILDAKKRGRKCFDFDFYLTANEYDLGFFRKMKNSEEEAWNQFIEMGVYEGRPHRWLC